MLSRNIFLFVFLILLQRSSFAANEAASAVDALKPLFDKANSDRILLVGYKDASINRVPSSADAYRKRGNYESSSWSERLSEKIALDYQIKKLAEWPMTEVDVHCVVYQVPDERSVQETIQELKADPRIEIVQNMHFYSTKALSDLDPYLQLQKNLQSMQITEIHHKSTGKQVKIAMIDTGVDLTHPDLEGQISGKENFADQISSEFSSDKHGTAIAGIMVAKQNNGAGIVGIAPDAELIALKACWPTEKNAMEAVCNSYTLALAVNKAIRLGVKILNMSLTGPYDPILELLLNKALDKGISVVAANTGSGLAAENFPASMRKVLSVESCSANRDKADQLEGKLMAPGEKILTTLPHATYDFISGSSIAAAEVSGVIALLLEIKPDLSHKQIRDILVDSQAGDSPGVNAKNALSSVCALAECNLENSSPTQLFQQAILTSENKQP